MIEVDFKVEKAPAFASEVTIVDKLLKKLACVA
jgi:hypothetical protein